MGMRYSLTLIHLFLYLPNFLKLPGICYMALRNSPELGLENPPWAQREALWGFPSEMGTSCPSNQCLCCPLVVIFGLNPSHVSDWLFLLFLICFPGTRFLRTSLLFWGWEPFIFSEVLRCEFSRTGESLDLINLPSSQLIAEPERAWTEVPGGCGIQVAEEQNLFLFCVLAAKSTSTLVHVQEMVFLLQEEEAFSLDCHS